MENEYIKVNLLYYYNYFLKTYNIFLITNHKEFEVMM